MDVRQHANIKESQLRQMKLQGLSLLKVTNNQTPQLNNTKTSSISESADAFLSFAPLELKFNAPQIVVRRVKYTENTH